MAEQPLGRVFTAAVGVAGDPVDDDWRADEYAAEYGHIWFAQSSKQLSVGDHLFAIGVSRDRAVLGLFEVLSSGDLRQPRNPWEPDRWPYATRVRALAGVAPSDAVSVDGVRTPRATAYVVQSEEQRTALYATMHGHAYAASQSPGGGDSGGLAERARALRRLRPFDPDAAPAVPRRDAAMADEDETLNIEEKAARAHHQLLVRVHHDLVAYGWTELGEIALAIDLQGRGPGGQRTIFEAKTISNDNETRQCRSALAQLLEYRQDYGSPDDALCLLVNTRVSDRRADLLERLGVAVVVAEADRPLLGANPGGRELLEA